jgi:hypothetical protein
VDDGGALWREVFVVGFTAYIDDSGTDPNQRVASATALVIPAARIAALENEWARLKEKFGFSDFHMSECVARNPKSDFAGLDDEKQEHLIRRVREITKKYAPIAFSFAVNKSNYDTLVPDELRYYAGKHFTWAIRSTIAGLDRWAEITRMTLPFEYIYDWIDPKSQKEDRDEIETVMAQAEDLMAGTPKEGRYTNYSFRKRKDIPALQCVDALAWTCYQRSLHQDYNVPVKQIAIDSWNDYFLHQNREWLGGFYMTRKQLQDWVNKEKSDGSSLIRFREWEAKRKNAKTKKVGQ